MYDFAKYCQNNAFIIIKKTWYRDCLLERHQVVMVNRRPNNKQTIEGDMR
jgi:hypothetical protein